jgi:hypothetical protein
VQGLKCSGKLVNSGVFIIGICPKEGLFDRLQFIVGQIFSIDAIADHKQLHVLKQAVIAPKNGSGIDWLKASLISMPERLSSICTNGNH